MHWIWSWLVDPEGNDPQKLHMLDLMKIKEKVPKAHAWDRTQNNDLLTSFF